MNCFNLERWIHQLWGFDHLRSCIISLLIERVLHELLLKTEVLKLLFSSSLTVLINRVIHESQFTHLCLLLVLHLYIFQNDFSSVNIALVPVILLSQEGVPFVLGLLQAHVSLLESLWILRSMVFDWVVGSFCDFTSFLILWVELVYRIQAESILAFLNHLIKLFEVRPLCLKLSPALVFDLVKCAWVVFCLALYVILYIH